MFQYSFADIQSQLSAFPGLLIVWAGWIGIVVLLLPFVFFGHRQGKVASVFSAAFIPLLVVLLFMVGISHIISFLHLAIWLPLLIYLSREIRTERIKRASALGVWSITAAATLAVSLVFDLRNAVRWVIGERGIIEHEPGIYYAGITIPAMIAVFFIVGTYIFGTSKAKRAAEEV